MAEPESTARFGFANLSPLKQWCGLYREGEQRFGSKPREGQAEGVRCEGCTQGPRARVQGASEYAWGAGGVSKNYSSEGGALSDQEKSLAVAGLSGLGHEPSALLEAAGLAMPSYYYALAHPRIHTMPELRPRFAEIIGRLPNGVGNRRAQ